MKKGKKKGYKEEEEPVVEGAEVEEEEKEEDDDKDNTPPSQEVQKIVTQQVDREFRICYDSQIAQKQETLKRLKLYNNQRRNKSAFGDPLLFTVFNTIFAALYVDRLSVQWEGKNEGDDEIEENLNVLAEYDYDVMEKSIVDYMWMWDAMFFPGGGHVLVMEFDRDLTVPVPDNIDSATLVWDNDCVRLNGIGPTRKKAARFFGYDIEMTKWEMEDSGQYFNLDKLKAPKGNDNLSLTAELKQARSEALNTDSQKSEYVDLKDNTNYEVKRWFTHWQGEKYLCETAVGQNVLIRFQPLLNASDEPARNWPVASKQIYPIPHDFSGVTIPDLVEDKQRLRAVMLNLTAKAAKDDSSPRYLYDTKKITNRRSLHNAFNKYIAVDGPTNNAIQPVEKHTIHNYTQMILEVLDNSAQKAVAAPELQQGQVQDEQKTLGELKMVSSKVDTRYGLSAKVFGWGEREFWLLWYQTYKSHYLDAIDEKMVRLNGPLGPKWKKLTREQLFAGDGKHDPDVRVDSKFMIEQKRLAEIQQHMQFSNIVMNDPTADKRFASKNLGKTLGLSTEIVNLYYPPTIEEMRAEEENDALSNEKLPEISLSDDHITHIRQHLRASQTPHALTHIEMHKRALKELQTRPDIQQMLGISNVNAPFSSQQGTQQVDTRLDNVTEAKVSPTG